MVRKHARIIQHGFTSSLQGALLDSYIESQRDGRSEITLGIRTIQYTSSELCEQESGIYERVQGNYVPVQLHFSGVTGLQRDNVFKNFTGLPADDPARVINDMLSWQQPEQNDAFFLFFMHQVENLMFFAHGVRLERLSDESIPFALERGWCPPPPMPGRLIPQPKRLHQRFGGDPITLYLGSQAYHQRLFIGGTDVQPAERPQVDVVFNLGENPSRWVNENQVQPPDRWDNKGEGADGMSLEIIREEAAWVIEHLRKDRRVLVHCAAGMNRSSTICCAVLILLEGLTAEQALARVREHHPWARPDSGHWLKLRWLAKTNSR